MSENLFLPMGDGNPYTAKTAGFKEAIESLEELISRDKSLKGDLAHIFLGFNSIKFQLNTEEAAKPLSQRRVCKELNDFISAHAYLARGKGATVVNQNFHNFVVRKNEKIRGQNVYSWMVLFLIYFHSETVDIADSFVFQEVGRLGKFIRRIRSKVTKDGWGAEDTVKEVMSFVEVREGTRKQRTDLGGMLEIGDYSNKELWKVIYGVIAPDGAEYTDASLQRHYVTYRLSTSSTEDAKIIKSFSVFQSPGRIRQHFAFKNFAKVSRDQIRRSSGGILYLGKTIACYGASQLMYDDGQVSINPNDILGPKAFIFDKHSFTPASGYLSGMILAMNNFGQCDASPLLCVQTEFKHSDKTEMGEFSFEEIAESDGAYIVDFFSRFDKDTRAGTANWADASTLRDLPRHPLY